MERFTGVIGIVVLLLIAVCMSVDRRRIAWRVVAWGLGLQLFFAWLLLSFPPAVTVFDHLAAGVNRVTLFADEGTAFLFGKLADGSGPWGFVFAIRVLPTIIFFAALMGVLYHWGIMQRAVAGVAWVLRRTMGITGVEALAAGANIFLGQTEAPLCVRPYIARMTRSQIMAIMVPGFASIAGSVLAAYIGILGGEDNESRVLFAKHLMTASLMSAPAGLMMAKIVMPETEQPLGESLSELSGERATRNVLDAAAAGATDGLKLAANVAAMLCAFVALLAMLNWPLAAFSEWTPIAAWRGEHGLPVFTFQNLIGTVFRPLAWVLGVPSADTAAFGSLIGQQLVATEFVAYLRLGEMVRDGAISPRTAQMATYALCGFCNFPSIAIQIGGLSAMAPERRSDFASLGLRAMFAGALACWMTGAVAGLFISG